MELKKIIFFYLLIVLFFLLPLRSRSHPTGSIVVVNDTVLWSYISPIADSDHHGCVMTWNRSNGVSTWLVSDHTASNWIISPTDNNSVYLIERYFDNIQNKFWIRVLKSKVDGQPKELWPWMEDSHGIGENGFKMLSNNEMIFASYPHVYRLYKNQDPEIWKTFTIPVLALRPLKNGKILIHSENEVQVIDFDGNLIQSWEELIEEVSEEDLPFFGNRIFDADFNVGLWTAYWGKRRFDFIANDNQRTVLLQLKAPWLPHGVAQSQQGIFLLASSLDPGSTINPRLWLWNKDNTELIWSEKMGVYDHKMLD